MNKNFGMHLPKLFFRGKKGNSGGEKETRAVEKEIFLNNSFFLLLPIALNNLIHAN
jgi:hypothetical protein